MNSPCAVETPVLILGRALSVIGVLAMALAGTPKETVSADRGQPARARLGDQGVVAPIVGPSNTDVTDAVDAGTSAPAHEWRCWPPDSENPCGAIVESIAMVGPADGWTVGSGGTIRRWNGSVWAPVASPTEQNLFSVTMLTPSDGWAVGGISRSIVRFIDGEVLDPCGLWRADADPRATFDRSSRDSERRLADSVDQTFDDEPVAIHWDGVAWTAHPVPTDAALVSVDMVAADDVWAVGLYGAILHWDGRRWAAIESPVTDGVLWSIDMVSHDDGWARGEHVLLRWDGRRWSVFPSTFDFGAIHMLSADDGWTVGHFRDLCQSAILRWDGRRWKEFARVDHWSLSAIRMLAPDDGWAVGSVALHWDGKSWSKVDLAVGPFHTIAGVPSGDAWAADMNGGFFRWDGERWSVRSTGSLNDRGILRAVDVDSRDNAWAVGDEGTLHRWDGHDWRSNASPVAADFSAVDIVAADDVWAVGDTLGHASTGTIVHWDGRSWTEVLTKTHRLRSVAMVSATDGWAVGTGVSHWNGAQWSRVEEIGFLPLIDVDAVAADDVWAVGDLALIRHWDGVRWSAVDSNALTDSPIMAVDMVSDSDGWAIQCELVQQPQTTVMSSVMLHWDGEQWSPRHRELGVCLQDIAMSSAGDGWAVGMGQMLHWDGASWTQQPIRPSFSPKYFLNAVAAHSAGQAWAVGYPILRLDEPAPPAPTETPTPTPTPALSETPTMPPTPTDQPTPFAVHVPWAATGAR